MADQSILVWKILCSALVCTEKGEAIRYITEPTAVGKTQDESDMALCAGLGWDRVPFPANRAAGAAFWIFDQKNAVSAVAEQCLHRIEILCFSHCHPSKEAGRQLGGDTADPNQPTHATSCSAIKSGGRGMFRILAFVPPSNRYTWSPAFLELAKRLPADGKQWVTGTVCFACLHSFWFTHWTALISTFTLPISLPVPLRGREQAGAVASLPTGLAHSTWQPFTPLPSSSFSCLLLHYNNTWEELKKQFALYLKIFRSLNLSIRCLELLNNSSILVK